jgi:hypothetical protein
VGIDAQLDPITNAKWQQIAQQGGKWEGLIMGGTLANPDVAASLATRYIGGGMFYTQMLVPGDFVKAVQNAITTPDFEAKQKYTHEAMKLMIDKYCLQIVLVCAPFTVASKPFLHNHGVYDTPNTGLWTPEDAWFEQ